MNLKFPELLPERRKKRIGEGVYYTWHESSIILKRELCVRKRVKF